MGCEAATGPTASPEISDYERLMMMMVMKVLRSLARWTTTELVSSNLQARDNFLSLQTFQTCRRSMADVQTFHGRFSELRFSWPLAISNFETYLRSTKRIGRSTSISSCHVRTQPAEGKEIWR